MKRLILLSMTLVLLVGGAPQAVTGLAAGEAWAQEAGKPRRLNLLDMIFGGALLRQRQPQPEPRARRVIVTPSGGGVVASPPVAPKEVVEKSEGAAKVLVAGDFMADGLHWGLEQAYAENPNVIFVNSARGLSGVVRDDVLDWPARLPEMIEDVRPVAVVVLVGMNDRQQMRVGSGYAAKLDDQWKAEYERRVEAIARAARDRALPLLWVGLPPVRSGAMNSDYLVFNEIYRTKTEAVDGRFIDVWDGYTNAEGSFVNAGPDVNGQIVRLRSSDGINMTRAGKAKLAFYAERELRKLPGLANDAVLASLPELDGTTGPLEPEYDPAATGRTIVVPLDSPMADGGETLEGGEEPLDGAGGEKATSFDLVVNGLAVVPRKGRIDYGWGEPGEANNAGIPQGGDAASPDAGG